MTSERLIVVADAGPIVALSIVGQLDILERLCADVTAARMAV